MPDEGIMGGTYDGIYEQAIQIARVLTGLAAPKDEATAKHLLKEIEGMLSGLKSVHAKLERRNAEMLEREITRPGGWPSPPPKQPPKPPKPRLRVVKPD